MVDTLEWRQGTSRGAHAGLTFVQLVQLSFQVQEHIILLIIITTAQLLLQLVLYARLSSLNTWIVYCLFLYLLTFCIMPFI